MDKRAARSDRESHVIDTPGLADPPASQAVAGKDTIHGDLTRVVFAHSVQHGRSRRTTSFGKGTLCSPTSFAGKARSHKGALPPGPLCELACKRNAPQARVPAAGGQGA
jgi:hypothetical protein